MGSATYRGLDVGSSLGLHRSRMGVVPQSDIIHAQLTTRQALGYAAELRSRRIRPRPSEPSVSRGDGGVGLSDRADQPIRLLSGGQRKRASVGIELLTKPSLLFLDEPTSGLDPGNEMEMMGVLRRLASDGRIVVVVTHSIASLDVADLVVFIAPGGQLAYFGPPADSPPICSGWPAPTTFPTRSARWLGSTDRCVEGRVRPGRFVPDLCRAPLDRSTPVSAATGAEATLRKGSWRQWWILVRGTSR